MTLRDGLGAILQWGRTVIKLCRSLDTCVGVDLIIFCRSVDTTVNMDPKAMAIRGGGVSFCN